MDPKKSPMDLVNLTFVSLMANQLKKGIKDERIRDDWQDIKWSEEMLSEYRSAILRHMMDADLCSGTYESLEHYADIANNCMIIAYHEHRRAQIPTERIAKPKIDTDTDTDADTYEETEKTMEPPPAPPQRVLGWVALAEKLDGGKAMAHYYTSSKETLCGKGPEIKQGSLRNQYEVKPTCVCEICQRLV